MDRQSLQMTGKKPVGMIPVCGNENNIPGYFKNLHNVRCFTIPASGRLTVAHRSLPPNDQEVALLIPVGIYASKYPAELHVNNMTLPIPGAAGTLRWDRIVTILPKNEKNVTVELVGSPGTTVAIGDIQIFQ